MASEPICSVLIASLEREYERSRHFLAQLESSLESSPLGPKPPSGASDTLDQADVDDEEDESPVAPVEVHHQNNVLEKHGLKKRLANFFKRNSSSFKQALGTPSATEDVTARISVLNVDATFEDVAPPHEASKSAVSFGPNVLLPTSALNRSARRTSFTLRRQPLHHLQERSDRRSSGNNVPLGTHADSTDMSQRVFSRPSLEIISLSRTTSCGHANGTNAPQPFVRVLQPPTQTASPSSPLSPATTTLPLLPLSPFSTKALMSDVRPHSLSSVTNPVLVSLEESVPDPRSGTSQRRNSFNNAAPVRPPTNPGSSSVISSRASHTQVGFQLPPTSSLRARSSNQIGLGVLGSPLGSPLTESRRHLSVRFPTQRMSECDDMEDGEDDDGRGYHRERLPKANTFRGTMHLI